MVAEECWGADLGGLDRDRVLAAPVILGGCTGEAGGAQGEPPPPPPCPEIELVDVVDEDDA